MLLIYLSRPYFLVLFNSAFLVLFFPFAFYKVLYNAHGVIQLCNLLENLLQFNLTCFMQWLTRDDLRDSAYKCLKSAILLNVRMT